MRSEPSTKPSGTIECAERRDVDGRADGIGIHVGPDGFGDLEPRDEVGGHRIHRDAACAELGRRADDLPVDGHVVQAGIDAADDHEAAFTLIDLHRDTGDTPKGLCRVVVGESSQRVGRHHVEDVIGGLLLLTGDLRPGGHRHLFAERGEREPEVDGAFFARADDHITPFRAAEAAPW